MNEINNFNKSLNNTTKSIQNKITLENRKSLTLWGVEEVLSSNESTLILKISGSKTLITGTNISISKLDIENKNLEATGNFNSIKFAENKVGFFKRIFK